VIIRSYEVGPIVGVNMRWNASSRYESSESDEKSTSG